MKVRRARQTAWRKIADETVLLDLAAKCMYGLNPTAAFVWQTLEAFDGRDAMLRALAGAGELPFGREELDAFLDELAERGLTQPVEADPAAGEPAAGEPAAGEPAPVLAAVEAPSEPEAPKILWQETVEQIAATCAFMPGQNPLCNQVPMS